MMNREKAFTLTEVIIVLVILGALALILVPNMSKMMPDDHNIRYKKAFYTIQEIVNDIVNDPSVCQGMNYDNASGNWTVPSTETRQNQILTMCRTQDNPPVARNLDTLICERLSTAANVNCNDTGNLNHVVTTNGSTWNLSFANANASLDNNNNTQWTAIICVDVDGGNSNINNCNSSQPEGVYRISIRSDGKVFPGSVNSNETEDNLLLNDPTN